MRDTLRALWTNLLAVLVGPPRDAVADARRQQEAVAPKRNPGDRWSVSVRRVK